MIIIKKKTNQNFLNVLLITTPFVEMHDFDQMHFADLTHSLRRKCCFTTLCSSYYIYRHTFDTFKNWHQIIFSRDLVNDRQNTRERKTANNLSVTPKPVSKSENATINNNSIKIPILKSWTNEVDSNNDDHSNSYHLLANFVFDAAK